VCVVAQHLQFKRSPRLDMHLAKYL